MLNDIQIVRYKEIAGVILAAFFGVGFPAGGEVFVLGVVQQEIFYLELLRQFASLLDGGMMLFVRVENLPILITAERLTQQPVRVFCIGLFKFFLIRLVAQTGKFLPGMKGQGVAKLLCLGGADIKEGHLKAHDVLAFQGNQKNFFADEFVKFSLNGKPGNGVYGVHQLCMAVNMQVPIVFVV